MVAVVAVLLGRVLRPWVLVRYGPLPTWRIGILAIAPEIYLCERDAGLHGKRVLDLFYAAEDVANSQLCKMWWRVIPIHEMARTLDRVSRHLPGHSAHVIPTGTAWDAHGLLATTTPHLSFTRSEVDDGDARLADLGLPPNASFVGFHARDPAYLSSIHPERDWTYHDYRDSDVETYLPAAREMARRGHYAVRMGAAVERPLACPDAMIIDYAISKARSDFLDVALCARCRFFLGNDSGILFVPVAFRRRVALANYIPLVRPPIWSPHDLFIPKKMWLRDERRFLTFREMRDPALFWTSEYESRGIEVIDSSPEEILALAIEMDERLNGRWETSEEDEYLQQRFRAIFADPPQFGPNLSRIGATFLRENRILLG